MEQPVTLEVLLVVIGFSVTILIGNFAWTRKSRGAMHTQINHLAVKVAENYATNDSLSEMEKRLVEHLNRIEDKVDRRNGSERR